MATSWGDLDFCILECSLTLVWYNETYLGKIYALISVHYNGLSLWYGTLNELINECAYLYMLLRLGMDQVLHAPHACGHSNLHMSTCNSFCEPPQKKVLVFGTRKLLENKVYKLPMGTRLSGSILRLWGTWPWAQIPPHGWMCECDFLVGRM